MFSLLINCFCCCCCVLHLHFRVFFFVLCVYMTYQLEDIYIVKQHFCSFFLFLSFSFVRRELNPWKWNKTTKNWIEMKGNTKWNFLNSRRFRFRCCCRSQLLSLCKHIDFSCVVFVFSFLFFCFCFSFCWCSVCFWCCCVAVVVRAFFSFFLIVI